MSKELQNKWEQILKKELSEKKKSKIYKLDISVGEAKKRLKKIEDMPEDVLGRYLIEHLADTTTLLACSRTRKTVRTALLEILKFLDALE